MDELTLGQMLEQTTGRYPHREALVFGALRWSYSELNSRSELLAMGMLAQGITHGSHVALWSGNHPWTVCCCFAAWKIGAVVIPICTGASQRELNTCLADADVEYLFFDEGFRGTAFLPMVQTQSTVPMDKTVAISGPAGDGRSLISLLLSAGSVSRDGLAQAKERVRPDSWDCFLFTSGSSGQPHAVVTTHASRVRNIQAQAAALDTTEQDRFCMALPLYHCFALSGSALAAVTAGACVCFPADHHTASTLETIDAEGCTVLSAVPTMFSAILAREDLSRYNLSSLRTGMIGGSAYPAALFTRIEERLGMTLLPSLGQTEATAGYTAGSPEDSLALRSTTVGRFFPGIDCRITEPGTDHPLPPNQVGEICIRGYNVMQGYYQKGTLSLGPVDQHGWLHTGDLGRLGEDGILCYRGRLRETIDRGGERISPMELETVLSQYPGISQVKVIGVPDSHYMEQVCACICPEHGITLAPDALRTYCQHHLAYYKVPRYFLFFDRLPQRPNGKPDGNALRADAIRQLGLETQNAQAPL